MNNIYEALYGFTDLPIAIIAFVLGVCLVKKTNERKYPTMFFLISSAAILGAVVHIVKTSKVLNNIIWVVLLPLLYESVRLFVCLFEGYITKREPCEKKLFYVLEIFCCLFSWAFLVLTGKYFLLCFVVFCTVELVRLICAMVKAKKIPVKAVIMVCCLPVLVILQGFCDYIPYSIVSEHIIITVLLIDIYLMALETHKKGV